MNAKILKELEIDSQRHEPVRRLLAERNALLEACKAALKIIPDLIYHGECGGGPQFSPCPIYNLINTAITLAEKD